MKEGSPKGYAKQNKTYIDRCPPYPQKAQKSEGP